MKEYIAYQTGGIFVFRVPGILTEKRRAVFEGRLEANEIKHYFLLSNTTNSAASFPEQTETYSAYKFMNLVNWAKLIQLADNDDGGSADIEDIVTKALQREASALERGDVPKKNFTDKRMN